MRSIVELVESLGCLHDAKILEFHWREGDRSLEIEIRDLFIDLEGFPDYPGRTRAKFVFSNVLKLDLDVDFSDAIRIYEWAFKEPKNRAYLCEIQFSPSGKMVIECDDVKCTTDDTSNIGDTTAIDKLAPRKTNPA